MASSCGCRLGLKASWVASTTLASFLATRAALLPWRSSMNQRTSVPTLAPSLVPSASVIASRVEVESPVVTIPTTVSEVPA